MCGIAGIFHPDGRGVSEPELKRMIEIIAYRGPDDDGFYQAPGIGIAHVRLAIQDLSKSAAQPMISHNQRYVLAYNGELYNVPELRTAIEQGGQKLKSHGDTEALLEYIAMFGLEKTLADIEGMFAFALWDSREKTLTLCRDRHGIKPLYYSMGPAGEIRFASEMKSLIPPTAEPDLCTVNAILLGLGGTWGEPTVFRGVKHVCAGEWIRFDANGYRTAGSFFHINDFIDKELYEEQARYTPQQAVRKVRDELVKSVQMQLISDAPVAVLASGGVDSSLVAAVASKAYPNLVLYHADVQHASETEAARMLADELGLEMRSVTVTDDDALETLARVTYHYEQPLFFHGGSCVPFYLVSKLVGNDGVKVVLTGEGSDEYFIGYQNYVLYPYAKRWRAARDRLKGFLRPIPAVGRVLGGSVDHEGPNQLRRLLFRYELEERRGGAAQAYAFLRSGIERDRQLMCVDGVLGSVRTLMLRNDRLAMAWGLESRFPFLGHSVARTALNLPSRHKIRLSHHITDWRQLLLCDKWVVRKVAQEFVPCSLAYRKKYGFRSTFDERIKVRKEFFHDGFMSEYYGLNERAVEWLLQTARGRWLARMISLEIWGQIFCLGRTCDSLTDNLKRYAWIEP